MNSSTYEIARKKAIAKLDAKSRKSRKSRKPPKKLKCKSGMKQVGAVCQPIKPKRKLSKAKKPTGIVSTTLLAAASAAVIARTKKNHNANVPQLVETIAKKRKLNTASKAAIATVAFGGMGAAAYLGARKRYRDGFPESAAMAEERAAEIKLGKVKPRHKAIIFGAGGGAYAERS